MGIQKARGPVELRIERVRIREARTPIICEAKYYRVRSYAERKPQKSAAWSSQVWLNTDLHMPSGETPHKYQKEAPESSRLNDTQSSCGTVKSSYFHQPEVSKYTEH